ncbi:T9SS sorting signal type C domain-containing protein [Flavobacterium sp. Sd200]|uniref:GEVED domain-containing protein n=1 Tax=Flavobacterium sp. Sd200 TaxID=2692211 RepID=UPI001371DE2A|nr:GEVED domain-containing protein [Flavobacterium sp. Sd200]MXN90412.1 T9SS sorting signal type C domain-containing protein [Flavobacterium sp. Sd200]
MKKNYLSVGLKAFSLFVFTFYNCFAQDNTYCEAPNNENDAYYITGITTSGGETDFSNTDTGFNGGYSDYTSSFTVSTFPGGSFAVTATHPSNDYLYGAWVDWNRDYTFSDSEQALVTGWLSSPAFLGNVIAPENIEPGTYRLRIRSAFRGTPMPCGEHAWGEAEDYSIEVLNITTCYPPYGLTVTPSPNNTKADLIWSHPVQGTQPTAYEYVFSTTSTRPTGRGTVIPENYVFEADYNPQNDYYLFVRSVCQENVFSSWEGYEVLNTNNVRTQNNDIVVYKEGNSISVSSSNSIINNITIYDTSGRKLYEQNNNSDKLVLSSLQMQQQVLILEVSTPNGKVNKRIVY